MPTLNDTFLGYVCTACKSGPNLDWPMSVNSIFIKDKYTVCCILFNVFHCTSGSEIKKKIKKIPQAAEAYREYCHFHTLMNRFPRHKSHTII